MPQRYIKVPPPVQLTDPAGSPLISDDGKPQKPFDLADLIQKLMHNPVWTESYPNVRSADAITKAVAGANGVLVLAEDDWKKLEAAVQNPRAVVFGSSGAQVVGGFGFHPVITPQILPLLDAIVNASPTPPVDDK
jgi:hypothetical protein